ncbi:SDR family NAD(P)-dependent oxidoreductase [Duganella aceris]|uniref:Glucose 1-dehydrogenase n=1 Tax=Duganella aceris TaxID=2703883 RepID=A0ABX0FPD9_9BURK|nr:glucose 1-dehydrogenase [Duganella aceris]NGZ86353.1 glucose 1-dehydrogenase [Duganella aceris]
MQSLSDKIALVTGSSKGIGAGIARALAAAGATVVLNYVSGKADAERVVAEIAAAGGKASAVQGDFSREEDIVRVYAGLKQSHGRLDILVNNAGVYGFGPIEELTGAEFHRQFNLNVLGMLLSVRESLPLFGPQGGAIINIGSIAGKMPGAMASIYAATKGAVDSLSMSLAKELGGRMIRVNSLNPGLIETEGTVAEGLIDGDFHQVVLNTTPLGRVGQPADIGKLAVLLSSDDAFWMTGQQLAASGGMTM